MDYEEQPREYYLSSVTTVVDVHTRVSDLYSHPYDQIKEQLRLAIETIKERQESELLHNSDYGILNNIAAPLRATDRAPVWARGDRARVDGVSTTPARTSTR